MMSENKLGYSPEVVRDPATGVYVVSEDRLGCSPEVLRNPVTGKVTIDFNFDHVTGTLEEILSQFRQCLVNTAGVTGFSSGDIDEHVEAVRKKLEPYLQR